MAEALDKGVHCSVGAVPAGPRSERGAGLERGRDWFPLASGKPIMWRLAPHERARTQSTVWNEPHLILKRREDPCRSRSLVDAVVIGGGPGGASAARALAMAGWSVLVLERADFPRFHIGESLLPGTREALHRLGLEERLESLGFVRKRGATFEADCGAGRARIDFGVLGGVRDRSAYQVSRAEFDLLLLRAAEEAGALVREGATVVGVSLGSPSGPHSTVTWEEGSETHEVSARFVVDASGRAGVLASEMGLRQPDPSLRKVALFAHFGGVESLEGEARGDIRVVLRENGGWAWIIPLAEGRTSVGLIFDRDEEFRLDGESAEACLDRWVSELPVLRTALRAAVRVGPARWESDYSYSSTRVAGPGWALVGDAACFLDPVFSSGVHLAVQRGLEVAEDLVLADRAGRPLDASSLVRSTRLHEIRLRRFRRFVLDVYRPGFRDIFLRPQNWPAGVRSLTAALAGLDHLGLIDRLRIAGFHALVGLNARLRFCDPIRPDDSEDVREELASPVLHQSP